MAISEGQFVGLLLAFIVLMIGSILLFQVRRQRALRESTRIEASIDAVWRGTAVVVFIVFLPVAALALLHAADLLSNPWFTVLPALLVPVSIAVLWPLTRRFRTQGRVILDLTHCTIEFDGGKTEFTLEQPFVLDVWHRPWMRSHLQGFTLRQETCSAAVAFPLPVQHKPRGNAGGDHAPLINGNEGIVMLERLLAQQEASS